MNYYIDIRVLPDPEFGPTTLMNAVYAKLHRALVAVTRNDVGISFPEAGKTPGSLLRLHSGKEGLAQLMEQNWLKGLRDYTEVSDLNPVPAQTAGYVRVNRVQPKDSAARLRRAVKRKSLTEGDAENLLANRALLNRPYFRLQSQSTGQHFPLFIEQGTPRNESVDGTFNAYGLSQQGTVPWF
jgi:CRISPR-associated endonuclease Csy4